MDKFHRRYYIFKGIAIMYDLMILPFRVVRLLLEWWNNNVTDSIVRKLRNWVLEAKEQ